MENWLPNCKKTPVSEEIEQNAMLLIRFKDPETSGTQVNYAMVLDIVYTAGIPLWMFGLHYGMRKGIWKEDITHWQIISKVPEVAIQKVECKTKSLSGKKGDIGTAIADMVKEGLLIPDDEELDLGY